MSWMLVALPACLLAVLSAQGWSTAREEYLPRPDYEVEHVVTPGGRVDHHTASVDDKVRRLAVLGDSTVEGIGAPQAETSLPVLVALRVASSLDAPVAVTGFGAAGARTADIVADQAPRLVGGQWDAVLVVVGSNDATHALPPWRMRSETIAALGAVRGLGEAPVVLGGIPEFHTVPAVPQPLRGVLGAHADVLRARQRVAAEGLGVPFVDIRAEASPRFLGRPESMSADGFHPSAMGYGFWADALAPAVVRALRHPSSR